MIALVLGLGVHVVLLRRGSPSTAADALRLWTTYKQEAAKMVIKDDLGQRVTVDELARLADRFAASKDAS